MPLRHLVNVRAKRQSPRSSRRRLETAAHCESIGETVPGTQASHGRLILGLTNLTPKAITLSHDDDLVSVEFHQLAEPTEKPYDGPFQGKTKLGPEEIEMITESSGGVAFAEVLTTLSSLSANVATLSNDVHELSAAMKTQRWLVPVLFGFVALLIAVFEFLGN